MSALPRLRMRNIVGRPEVTGSIREFPYKTCYFRTLKKFEEVTSLVRGFPNYFISRVTLGH